MRDSLNVSRLRAAAAILALSLTACGPAMDSGAASAPSSSGVAVDRCAKPLPLRAATDMPGAFQWRQRVTATWPTGERSFDAVIQRRGDTLMLVGLSPMGQPGFVFTLDAKGSVSVKNHSGQELPFEPAFIFADVQRAFFPWIGFDGQKVDGESRVTRDGVMVVEHRVAGTLFQRRLTLTAPGCDRASVTVRYNGWEGRHTAPKLVELEHEALGYRLVIETVEEQGLTEN